MKNLAIIVSHPIQYYAPLFALLEQSKWVNCKVFYTWGQAKESVYDPGFGNTRSWDIPLLDGYDYEFLLNTSKQPGSHHFKGINNPGIIQAIDAFKPTAILVIGWAFKSHLKILRHYKNKVPIWFRGDSTLLEETKGFSIKKIARKYWLTWVYSHIKKAFYVGQNNKAYYLKHGVKQEQLIFAPHAIDNQRFQYPSEVISYRKELGIADEVLVFLCAGKMEKVKNMFFLLSAFIKVNIPDVVLLFVGNGAEESLLKNNAREYKNVYFLPFQNQLAMPSIYRTADCFVMTSTSETWGLAVNEALASGIPCIVSNKCGCAADLIENGNNGYVFESNNQAALLAAMQLVQAKHQLLKANIIANNKINQYSFKQIITAIEQQINTL